MQDLHHAPLDDGFDDLPHTERLAHNEVAAVHVKRRFYVNDVPSPYLTTRQAREDIETTRRRHTIISTVCVLLLLAAIAAGAGWFIWDTLKPEPTREVPTYNTTTITRMEFVDSIDSTSIVQPIDERSVFSEVSGTVVEVLAAEGAVVNEGDVLYTLENPTISETLVKAQEALDVAQADYDAKAAALDTAQKALEELQKKNESSSSSSDSTSSSTSSGSSSSTGSGTTGTNGSGTTNGTRNTDDQQGDADDANETTTIARSTTEAVFHAATLTSGPSFHQATNTNDADDDTTNSSSNNGTGTSTTNGNTSTSSNSSSNSDSSSSSSSSSSSNSAQSQAIQQAESRVRTAQQELNEAREHLEPIQEMRDRAQDQVDHLTVRSPITGTLSDLNANAKVAAGLVGSERLCTVSDLTAYLVQEEIPNDRTGQVYAGEEVRLSFPSVGDLFVTATVASIWDTDEGSRIANVVIENPDERITKNMACNVSIVVQSIPNALVVPKEAVTTNAEGGSELNVLLDPSRGINAYVPVNVIATNATQAAVEADSIQEGTSAILPGAEPEAEAEPAPEG